MSHKFITIFVLIVAVIAGGVWWALSSSPAKAPAEPNPISVATGGVVSSNGSSLPSSGAVVTPAPTTVASDPAPTPKPTPAPTPKPTPPSTGGPTPTGPKSYTMAEVAKHASQSDCWSVVDGSVYNLTSWIAQHPGGVDAIISMCGVDGSSGFNNEHSGESRPANELAEFKIGALTK